MKAERGQALVFAVVLLGLAALAVVGVGGAAGRLLEAVRDDRIGEAAAAAGGSAVADLKAARELALGRDLDSSEIAALAASSETRAATLAAAARIAAVHGHDDPPDVSVRAFGYEIEVQVRLAGRTHIALLEAAP